MSTSINTTVNEVPQFKRSMFFVVSIRKLTALNVLTLGLYFWYWSYQNWAVYRASTGARVSPLLRSLIPFVFLYPLLLRVEKSLEVTGKAYRWSPFWLVVGLIMSVAVVIYYPTGISSRAWHYLIYVYYAPDMIRSWFFLLLYPLPFMAFNLWVFSKMQKAINLYEGDLVGEGNSRYTLANWLWSLIGVYAWINYLICLGFLVWTVMIFY